MAGKHQNHKGSGTNTLCLHNTPKWGSYKDGTQKWRAYVYGAEYEPDDGSGKNLVPGLVPRSTDDQIAPCTVCRLKLQREILMIPGTTECSTGWTKEYDGHLMAPRSDVSAGEFLCIDRKADIIAGGKNSNQFSLYPTEAKCGSLLCPPYVDGRELTCVVCSG
ncbi:hypothetical protein FSP39_002217 [Pinctada imbricata]|uniref:Short-chain collagen C4-like n=1 Tax=Pinctada imbricata TaxID=66713 RepID=A0AA88XHE2_PINIB|nr:hypothetical protein FSP39_002217 [Pinctada imbricata]